MNAVVKFEQQPSGLMALGTGNSVLGETQARIPIGGKIRAGIKVLTSAGSKHPKAAGIYQDGVLAGDSWDAIEKRLKEACGFDRSPLTPKNVPYFTARRSDFTIPEMADRIMHLYGEDRGDRMRLYRFPIVLPLDTWLANMPHGLKEYSRSELIHWSDYGPDNNRYCYTRGAVEVDPRNKRARRVFGGRPVILRDDNGGQCIPEKCPEYQNAKCKLSGGLVFYVPGVAGSSAIQLPTTSFYSLSQWRQQMEMVGFLRGRLSGLGPDNKPVFWLSKKQEEISMIDPETGRPKRVMQYLVNLEADIDMSRVFRSDVQALPGSDAAAMLCHDVDGDDEALQGVVIPADEPPPPPPVGDSPDIKVLRKAVFAALQVTGIAPELFDAHARRQWGDNWSHITETLKKARSELLNALDNLPAYIDKIAPITSNDCPF